MVKVEIWDDINHHITFNKVEKIDAVERLLNRITNVESIVRLWGCVNFVKISLQDSHINIHFTDKQYKKYEPILEEMNGGEIEKRYVR